MLISCAVKERSDSEKAYVGIKRMNGSYHYFLDDWSKINNNRYETETKMQGCITLAKVKDEKGNPLWIPLHPSC